MKHLITIVLTLISFSGRPVYSMNNDTKSVDSCFENNAAPQQEKLAQYLKALLKATTTQKFDTIYDQIVHDHNLRLDEATLFALAFVRIGITNNQ